MYNRLLPGLCVATAVLGCGGDHGGHGGLHAHLPPALPLIKPEPREGMAALGRAVDRSADPKVVEVDLRAGMAEVEYLPGKRTSAWAYNGAVPGPLVEARRGDRVLVHFKNELPEATTIHWHGLRVPNAMDGAGHLTHAIPPGGSFDYDFVVPDAGTFWFHPHVRSDEQVEKGLYGVMVVRDEDEPMIPAAAEHVIVLDDVLVDPATGALDIRKDRRAAMMGREGNLVLVNGKPSNAGLTVRAGERTRLRIVNTANARYFRLALTGGSLVQVGGDGGLLPTPRVVPDALMLVPGERADVLIELSAPGGTAVLRSLPYERAQGAGTTEAIDLLRFIASNEPSVTAPALPASLRSVETLSAPGAVERRIRLGERMGHHDWEFTINGQVSPKVPLITATQGTRELWTVENESDMDHPFHLHGFFFQRVGVPEWKDTINIPGKAKLQLVVDLAARDGAAGGWMYHCHILEHAEGGMMGELMVR